MRGGKTESGWASAPLLRVSAGIVALLVVSSLGAGSAQAAPEIAVGDLTAQDVNAWLDGAVPTLLEREAIPGATVAVVHEGRVLTERGYGMADVGSATRAPVPMDPRRTLMRVGSISKVPVAVAVMQLVERGELDLDEPITMYTDIAPEASFDTPVTMRHLLTHTAGYEEVIRKVILQVPAKAPTLDEYLLEEAPKQIYAPGTVPAYSNYGYALAARIVEEISGQEVGEYLQTQVLRPAGADTATYQQPLPEALDSRVARPYPTTHDEPIGFELAGAWPAGSMSASASDMGAFMLALLDGESSPILGADAMATMYAPGLSEEQLGTRAAGNQMALGLFEQHRNGHRILGHGGDMVHSHAAFQIYPDDGTGIFIGLNGSGKHPDSSLVLRGVLFDDFTDRYYPSESGPAKVLATSAEHAAAATGMYISSRRGQSTFMRALSFASTVTVHSDGDTLVIPALADASGHPVELRETKPWVFEDESGAYRVAIGVENSGAVTSIALMSALTLLPAPAWYTPVLMGGVAALVILAIALVAWPARVVIGWRLGAPLELARKDRWLRRTGLLAALLTFVAVGLWLVMTAGLVNGQGASNTLVRSAQVATLLGVLGIVPATWRAVRAWIERSWLQAIMATLIMAAFAGITIFAIAGGLLLPNISY